MDKDRYEPVEATDITDELIEACADIVDGWYQDRRVNWEDVWDRLDGREMNDGRILDLGDSLVSPALLALQRKTRKFLNET